MNPHALIRASRNRIDDPDPQPLKATARRILPLAAPYKWLLIAYLATILVTALISLVPPMLFGRIIDDAIPNRDSSMVNMLSLVIVGSALTEAVMVFLQRWWQSRIGEGLIFDLRVRLFDHVQRMPLSFFTRTQTGALISRMNNDVIGAQRSLTGTLGQVVSNVVVLFTVLVAMFSLEWRLTLVALAILPLFLLPARRVGDRMQRLTRQQMNENAEMNSVMTERLNVSGALVVKLFGTYKEERSQFANRAAKVRDLGIASAVYGRAFTVALTLVGALGAAAIYWLGARLVISGSMTVGTLVTLSLLVARVYVPLTALTNARVDVMTSFVSFERVFEVLDMPNAITDKPDAIDLVDTDGAVRFDDVWFRYGDDEQSLESLEGTRPGSTDSIVVQDRTDSLEPVLRGISLDVAPGELVALVGRSGAGKSTMVSLIPRLYDVTKGAVLLDGHDVRDVTQDSLRRSIGVVVQDPHLFHDTVGNNLRYAKPDATDAEVMAACAAAQVDDVILALPDGLDTVVGERGYRLSGGEKQRLSIARMILKDPAVVILDEATSHLDSDNEKKIQLALSEILADRTAVVIAHRLSTITAADKIAVLDDGHLVELGTHDELLESSGLYAELYTTLVSGGNLR